MSSEAFKFKLLILDLILITKYLPIYFWNLADGWGRLKSYPSSANSSVVNLSSLCN